MAAVRMNSTATSAAMPARITLLGMVALTSVYPAPVMVALAPIGDSSVRVAYWSSQTLTACSAT